MFSVLSLVKHRPLKVIRTAGLFIICFLLTIYCYALSGLIAAPEAIAQEKQYGPTNQRVAVLVFHAVGVEPDNTNVIRPEDLEATFQALKDGDYRPISLDQFHAFINGHTVVPPRAVLLTFDDGYRDIYEFVFPLTKRFNYPAVVFAISKWFDRYPRPEISREHLSLEEAGELLRSGLWRIGGHSYDGHRLVRGADNKEGAYLVTRTWLETESRLETEEEYCARVWMDITLNNNAIKLAGESEPQDFAFPYGAYCDDLVKMLKEAGCTYLYTNNPGLNEPRQDPSNIRRIGAGRKAHETMAVLEQYFGQYKN